MLATIAVGAVSVKLAERDLVASETRSVRGLRAAGSDTSTATDFAAGRLGSSAIARGWVGSGTRAASVSAAGAATGRVGGTDSGRTGAEATIAG